jgi:hypothetical protein
MVFALAPAVPLFQPEASNGEAWQVSIKIVRFRYIDRVLAFGSLSTLGLGGGGKETTTELD